MVQIGTIQKELRNISDIKYRQIVLDKITVTLVYINSLCDTKGISEFIIKPIIGHLNRRDDLETIAGQIIYPGSVSIISSLDLTVNAVLSGKVIVHFSHLDGVICCELVDYAKRAVDIPQTETVIKGPREGFTESMNDNISSIRRRIKSPLLKVESFEVGVQTKTSVTLLYMEGLAPEKLLNFVRKKISGLSREFVIYSNHFESTMRSKWTPFDTLGSTEKPDVAVSKLSEGRVVIVMDGVPFATTAPMFFMEHFQTTDDYTMNIYVANMGRFFRWTAFILSTFTPGLYLALVTYHYKLVPNIFLYRLALFRAGVPVPTVVELLYMMLFFQIIREAGVRLPQPIGPTLSIVGALILGESAVASGLSSQITVIVVAITSVASYLCPTMHAPIFIFGVILVLFAAFAGLPGFYMGVVVLVAHLSGLKTCDYPFMHPVATFKTYHYRDILFRGSFAKINRAPLPKGEQK